LRLKALPSPQICYAIFFTWLNPDLSPVMSRCAGRVRGQSGYRSCPGCLPIVSDSVDASNSWESHSQGPAVRRGLASVSFPCGGYSYHISASA